MCGSSEAVNHLSEDRRPKPEFREWPDSSGCCSTGVAVNSDLGLRVSFGLRSSGLGFGIARTNFRGALANPISACQHVSISVLPPFSPPCRAEAPRRRVILLGSAQGVVNEVNVSQQLARRDPCLSFAHSAFFLLPSAFPPLPQDTQCAACSACGILIRTLWKCQW
jgi:hypothetical protein